MINFIQDPDLSPATRLVIEIVRRGSAQNLVIIRSGLTLTNRLSPRLAVEVGLTHHPTSSSIPSSSVMKSNLSIGFGDTQALPLALAARRENGERLCFRPVLTSANKSEKPRIFFEWSRQLAPCNDPDTGGDEMKPVTSLSSTMDWRRLTKPGDMDECVMTCRCVKSDREIGLYFATTESPKHSSHHSPPPSRDQSNLPWQFCVTAVRDNFPPDPDFREG